MPRSPAGFFSPIRRSRVFRVFTFHIVRPAERFRLELTGVPYEKEEEAPGCEPSTLPKERNKSYVLPQDHGALAHLE